MPGCKMKFNSKGGRGGKGIGSSAVTIGVEGREIHSETSQFGGSSMPIMNPRPAVAPPKARASTGGRK